MAQAIALGGEKQKKVGFTHWRDMRTLNFGWSTCRSI